MDAGQQIEAKLPSVHAAGSKSASEWVDSLLAASSGQVMIDDSNPAHTDPSLHKNVGKVLTAVFSLDGRDEAHDPAQSLAADVQSSIRMISESIHDELPRLLKLPAEPRAGSLNQIMLQDCFLLNSLVQRIKLLLQDLDMRASNEEIPETKEMLSYLRGLQSNIVPDVWAGPGSSGDISLSAWLHHLKQTQLALASWLAAEGSTPTAVRLAYTSNPTGLLVALRSDVATRNGWDLTDTVVQIEPLVDGKPMSGAPISNALVLDGVTVWGATWNASAAVLELAASTERSALSLCAVCKRAELPSDAEEEMVYYCPIGVGKLFSGATIMVRLPTSEKGDEYTKRGVRMVLPEEEAVLFAAK